LRPLKFGQPPFISTFLLLAPKNQLFSTSLIIGTHKRGMQILIKKYKKLGTKVDEYKKVFIIAQEKKNTCGFLWWRLFKKQISFFLTHFYDLFYFWNFFRPFVLLSHYFKSALFSHVSKF